MTDGSDMGVQGGGLQGGWSRSMMVVAARRTSLMMLSYLWKRCISDLLTDLTTLKDFVFSIPALLVHPSAIFDSANSFDGLRKQLCHGLMSCGMLLCHLVMSVGSFASSSFLFNAGLLKHCTTARRRGVGGLRVVRAAVLAAALLTPCQALSYALTAQPPQDHSPPAAAHTAAGHVLLRSNSSPRFRRLGGDDGVNDVEAEDQRKCCCVQRTISEEMPFLKEDCVELMMWIGIGVGIGIGGLVLIAAILGFSYVLVTAPTNARFCFKFGRALFFHSVLVVVVVVVVVVGDRELNHWKLRCYQRSEHR
eukprot:GHVS01068325.1.p1 GENE.GHVS01068325.1~~GHVS01068325.1.p1  ORF type:complete len:307 (-),score=42.30 GHVS01068325.1:630-1550(-)